MKICICSYSVQNQILLSFLLAFRTTIFYLLTSLKPGLPLHERRIFANHMPRRKFRPMLDKATEETEIISKTGRDGEANHSRVYKKCTVRVNFLLSKVLNK